MSELFNRDDAALAVRQVMPAILAMMQAGETNRSALHIVIMDPGKPMSEGWSFEEAILHQQSIGEPSTWEYPFDRYALSKSRQVWRTGQDGYELQQRRPYLLAEGDTIYAGGVNLLGIVVACSGVRSFDDESFGYMIAARCRAIAIANRERREKAEEDFLGTPA